MTASDPNTDYAFETLWATPPRAVQLLCAIGTSLSIRTILARHGYGRADQEEGWRLVRACAGDDDMAWPATVDEKAQDALIEVDAWDERGFAIVSATLWHRYPQQAHFLLSGIGPSQGAKAVVGVRELLDRLDALEAGATGAKEDDRRAIEAIGKRGLGKRERARLRKLVELADPLLVETAAPASIRFAANPTQERLVELRAWYDEWTQIARATISREDHLVRMGLASPRRRDEKREPAK